VETGCPQQLVVRRWARLRYRRRGGQGGGLALEGKKVNGSVGAWRGLPATSSSSWNNGRLVTTLSVTAPNGSIREYQEARYLDDHGRLVVETTVAGRPNSRKSVYVKKW